MSAQARLNEGWEVGDTDLLNHLTAVWCVTGYLSCKNMKSVAATPVPNTYLERFGSLENAYRLVGYKRTHVYRYAALGSLLRQVDRDLICLLTSEVQRRGGAIRFDEERQVLELDGKLAIATVVLPFMDRAGRRAGWWLHFDRMAKCDLMLIVRMTRANMEVLDYHLMPLPWLAGPTFRFEERKMAELAKYRLGSPADMYEACRRARADACR